MYSKKKEKKQKNKGRPIQTNGLYSVKNTKYFAITVFIIRYNSKLE